ncbi:hypothetical protein GCM10011579_094140 [Streptomyces albiflavescens]|uniref:Uncharacterized protein n=1 Tax=Streptomyces albiflavescens TaxID=1623582 RepID=A0A917YGT6_9ACTN|nr:hypothetical protein [Streptomyces albiflavescens]GGN94541.1 hypothetical protein GCM10011579_094140 [Streptomyces albiflavescens]
MGRPGKRKTPRHKAPVRQPEEQQQSAAPKISGRGADPLQRLLRVVQGAGNAAGAAALQPNPAGAGGSTGGTPAYATTDLKRRLAATVLAESTESQQDDIRWIYFNLVSAAKGEGGLAKSSAYSHKSIWYRIWLHVLGDTTYGKDPLPGKKKEFSEFKGQTVKDFCEKNGWIKTVAAPRGKSLYAQVESMFTNPTRNPYENWTGQGNLADFNNKSNRDVYWKKARAYWWLQKDGKVKSIHVKVLPAGKDTQFIFNPSAIDAYFRKNPLPAKVPEYVP